MNERKASGLTQVENIYFDLKEPVALFTGRERELIDLHNLIQRSANINKADQKNNALSEKCTIIAGLGGTGKTQLALRYVQLHHSMYNNNILWINAETESSISSSFQILASERLNIKLKSVEGQEKTIGSVVAEVYKFFSNTKALFIFDNADGPFQEIFFPTVGRNPFILITSRMQKWGEIAVLRLDTFTEADATQFVKKGLKVNLETQNENINDLVKLLNNFPLALQQAVSYIKETYEDLKGIGPEYKIVNYLSDFKQKAQSLLDHKFYNDIGIQSSTTTCTTWIVTIDKIKHNKNGGQLAMKMLNSMSYFASNKINTMIFLPLTEGNDIKLATARKLLITYSMVNQDDNGLLNVHPLVQEITLFNLKADKGEREHFNCAQNLLIKYFQIIVHFDQRQQFLLPHLESLLFKINAWVECTPLMKNVIEQENIFTLLQCLADGYDNFDCRKTVPLLEELLLRKEKSFGLEHFEVAITLNDLGRAYRNLITDPKMRKDLYERALSINEKHYGPDHFEVAKTLNNLGNAYFDLGDPKSQKAVLERALPINEKHYGNVHGEVARILNNLGNVYHSLGDAKMEKLYYERALSINEEYYGQDHFEVARNLVNLSRTYNNLGDHKTEKVFLERALSINEKHYGPDHFEVAFTLVCLGITYSHLGDHKTQKALLERALSIEEKHYGPDHFEVAKTLCNLGNACDLLGDFKMKKELVERALLILENHYGQDHFVVAKALTSLGNAYGELGDPKMHKGLLERALAIKEKHYGHNHFEVAVTLTNLGNAYGSLGYPKLQKDTLERALSIKEKHFGPDHFEVAVTLISLGNAYCSLGDPKTSIDILERSMNIFAKHNISDHSTVAIALLNLGNFYGILENPKMQQVMLVRALSIFEKNYGPDHLEVARTLYHLGHAYCNLGDHEMQIVVLERELSIKEKHYGPDHHEVAITLTNLGAAYGNLGDHKMQKVVLERALPILKNNYGLLKKTSIMHLAAQEYLPEPDSQENLKKTKSRASCQCCMII